MAPEGDLDYAIARVQAHYGRRLGASDWLRLEASRDLGQFLEVARRGMFASWVAAVDANRDPHSMERSLRSAWRHYVESVATWHPRAWQPWIAWLEWLPTLSLLPQLARTEPAPMWLMADPVGASVAKPGEKPGLSKRAELGAFEPALAGRARFDAAWLERWLLLRPPADAHTLELLHSVTRAVAGHRTRLADENAEAAELRRGLGERFAKLFRASAGTVIATLCHLALVALDFERFRGGMVTRRLLAAR